MFADSSTPTALRRRGRRALLRYGALAGAGWAGAWALACGSTAKETKSAATSAPAATAVAREATAVAPPANPSALGGLIGRTTPTNPNEPAQRGGTFTWVIFANPASLDPQQNVSINTLFPASAVYSRLFRFKNAWQPADANNKEIQPDLALSAESADALTWTIKLRPGVRMQNVPPLNGRPLDADDVRATFVKALAPTSTNRAALSMIDPDKIETPSADTLVFKLKYPYAPLPKLLASATFAWILPKEATTGGFDPARRMAGSGPFLFESFTPDVALTFKRNPDWFEQGKPYVDTVRLAIVPDAAQRMAQFTAGNLDVIGAPTQDDVPTLIQQNPKAEVIKNIGNGNGIMYYMLGEQSAIHQDIRIRQATSLAVDRAAYSQVFYRGQSIRTFNVTPDLGKWAITWEEIPPATKQWYEFDLQKAKQLLEAAGGTKLSIKMAYPVGNPADPQLGRQGETVFAMLKALPWNITYVPIDYNKDWIAGGKGYGYGFMPADSMAWWGLSTRTEVDDYIFGFWHSTSTGNISRLNDPRIDAMIDKARTVLNEDERAKAYKQIQQYILENVYCLTGMVNGVGTTFVQPRVRNYTIGDSYGLGASYWAQLWLKS